jgi:hypothetical protein
MKTHISTASSIMAGLGLASSLGLAAPSEAIAQTATTLLTSGPSGSKKNLVIIGDGFQTGNGQDAFNKYVTNTIMRDMFGEGPLRESMNAFNITRVNIDSTDNGVTQATYTASTKATTITTQRNTALDYIFYGTWEPCWMRAGSNTDAAITAALKTTKVTADYVFVVLNDAGFGGCRSGDRLAVTLGAGWATAAHEMGHMIGDLADEYSAAATFTGDEPGNVNLTINTNRSTLKWLQFLDPGTAISSTSVTGVKTFGTPFTAAMNATETVGLFVGGTIDGAKYNMGIYRPASNARMNSNAPVFGPVEYDRMKEVMHEKQDHDFRRTYPGDFDGDGRTDLVVHNGRTLELYRSDGTHLVSAWAQTLPLDGWDYFRENDRFFVGDFDGDGMDDLYVINATDWSMPYLGMLRSTGNGFEAVARYDGFLPGWDAMQTHDELYAGDFDGDGKADLYIKNSADWEVGYVGMLRSTGTRLTYVRRFDEALPGWDLIKGGDRLYLADVDGNGTKDLYVFNYGDWDGGYLEPLLSTGTNLTALGRYDRELDGWGAFLGHDQLLVADFTGEGAEGLYLWNPDEWNVPYLAAVVAEDGGYLRLVNRWDGAVPGWDLLAPHDRFFVGDANGDRKQDLYGYNGSDWSVPYLGVLRAGAGASLTGFWQESNIGGWPLRSDDDFVVAGFGTQRASSINNSFQGGFWPRRDDLIVVNNGVAKDESLGLLRSRGNSIQRSAMYPKWIHHHLYESHGWW